jgi:hypothetical protein
MKSIVGPVVIVLLLFNLWVESSSSWIAALIGHTIECPCALNDAGHLKAPALPFGPVPLGGGHFQAGYELDIALITADLAFPDAFSLQVGSQLGPFLI